MTTKLPRLEPPNSMSNDKSILDTIASVLWRWCEYHDGDAEHPPGEEISKVATDWYKENGRRVHVLGKYYSNPDERQRLWNAVCEIEEGMV